MDIRCNAWGEVPEEPEVPEYSEMPEDPEDPEDPIEPEHPKWEKDKIYIGGDRAYWNDSIWESKWWT